MCSFHRFILSLYALVVVVATIVLPGRRAAALPIEPFSDRYRLPCKEGQRVCSGLVRGYYTIGGATGISISKSTDGEVKLEIEGRSDEPLSLAAEQVSELALTLSWDGDSNPEQLSASGLPCVDLTRQGGHAFVLPRVSLDYECADGASSPGCPSFVVETRIYNPIDPTGQKFSSSVVTRVAGAAAELVIPFSNFIQRGPRGSADFSCVGAITMTFRFSGFDELEFAAGPFFTNGAEGLTPIPTATREPTATPTLTPTSTPTSSPTAAPSATPIRLATGAPKPTLVLGVATEVSASSEVVHARGAASRNVTPEPSPRTESTPANSAVAQSEPSVKSDVGETVYGEVVAAY